MRRSLATLALLLGPALLASGTPGCADGAPGAAGEQGSAGRQTGTPGPDSREDGPQGPDGPAAEIEPRPSLAACEPGALYLGHTATVTVSGDDTAWSTGAVELTLGEGVAIDELVVASATALVADVVVGLDATPGEVDVAVTDAGGTLSLPGALTVLPSLVVQGTRGDIATGSSFVLDVVAPDLSAPLDPGALRVVIPGAPGVHPQVEWATPYAARVRVNTDLFADPGELDLVLESGIEAVVASRAPRAIPIVAREPQPLDLTAMPTDVATPAAGGSHLYALAPPDPLSRVKLDLVVTGGPGGDDGGEPTMVVIPPSGVLGDFVGRGTSVTFLAEGSAPYFVLVIDETGIGATVYDLVATVTPAPPGESEPNDTCQTASDVVTAFPASFNASLAGDLDEDWFAIELDLLQGAQRLRARTTAGESDTDVELTIFADDCTTVAAGPRDIDFHENLLAGPLGAGTWLVRVRPSPVFPFVGSLYDITFTLEP